jgi:hypothetical protein
MLASKLVRLIEANSERLSDDLLAKFLNSEKCSDLRKVPADEIRDRTCEIYRNLSDWLLSKTEDDIATRYMAIGQRRASQAIALSHVVYAMTITKEHLQQFVQRETLSDTSLALYSELELVLMLDQFFDRALYYATRGYERAMAAGAPSTSKVA